MFYFKEPSISTTHYRKSLENLSKSLAINNKECNPRLESVTSLIDLLSVFISTHCEQFGAAQTRLDLRLLGNAIRIASQANQDISYAATQLTWGINAGALDLFSSGETSFLKEACKYIRKTSEAPIIFDIGANKGEWSAEVIANIDSFSLHIFEPNTSMQGELSNTIKTSMKSTNQKATAHINMLGIAKEGKNILYVNNASNEQATTVLNSGEPMYKNFETMKIKTTEGSAYCKAKGIENIDFIKIDTEGSEYGALTTFDKHIIEGRIRFIQFEYGMASFYGNSSLNNFFKALKDRYSMHRILPEGITKSLKYSEEIETFHWSNYIAIRKDSMDFLEQLTPTNPYT